jgi:hypothetical protein
MKPMQESARPSPALGNPLLDELVELDLRDAASEHERDRLIRRYAFAVPTADVLQRIRALSPAGVVEIGAGTGYWSRLLRDVGTSVRAYDRDPPPTSTNAWFAGSTPWLPVEPGDESVADDAPPATLLLVWPTRDETWATSAAQRFHAAGGTMLFYVGEGPGGRTGDDTFHAVLGELAHCNQCEYGVVNAPCICAVTPLWRAVEEHSIPTWPGFCDSVRIYERTRAEPSRQRRRWLTRRAKGR